MNVIHVVAELTTWQPQKFAVLSVDTTRKHPDGGVVATVKSLHYSRAEADRAALNPQQATEEGV